MNGNSYARIPGHIELALSRLRGHVERVSRRAHQHGRSVVNNRLESLSCRLSAARNGHRAQLAGSLPSGPKADERTERKGEINAIGGPSAGGLKDELPA